MPTSVETFKPTVASLVGGYNIGRLMGVSSVTGDIGLEIEVEGNVFKKQHIPSPWKYVKDGSLRGEDNAEYILRGPIKFEEVPKALNTLWDMFKETGSVLDVSNRTSVHVHLNVQDFYLNRFCAFTAMYFCIEELLTAWAGDHRVGNLFCLRGKDAPAIVSDLRKFFENNQRYEFYDGLHYAGFNPQALNKFGSIEIRTLRGCTDPETILAWVRMLERLYRRSEDFQDDPRRVVDGFSGHGPIAFLQDMMGPEYNTLRNGIPHTNQEVMEVMYDGIRLAQGLCYCRDWSLYRPIDPATDPFGRLSSKGLVADAVAANQVSFQQFYVEYGNVLQPPATQAIEPSIPDWVYDEAEDVDFD